jgi:hypothetical protein
LQNDDYERGFADGLKWVATQLRRSAALVEAPVRGDYKRADGPSISAIARTGQPHLAAQYRAVAQLLEEATDDDAAPNPH